MANTNPNPQEAQPSTAFKTQEPMPADLAISLERVALRPDGWATKGPMARDAASRPHYAIRMRRNGRDVGPFYWTGPVDMKHALAIKDGALMPGKPRGRLSPEEAMSCLAMDANCYADSGPDLDAFASEFGYDSAKPSEALRAFEACRRAWEAFALLGLDPHAPCFQEA